MSGSVAASLLRRSCPGSYLLRLPTRGSTRLDQQRLGKFPVPPEHYFQWKSRLQSHGGYIQQSISFYQLKTIWPFWHQSLLRNWGRWSQYWNMWVWPLVVVWFVIWRIEKDMESYVEDKFWY
eukprot:GHVS01040109.1.p1 GENE.GHVS01040109.1~~GHVS01040109.1.p1  ORF type:complete len:122 (+),score=5.41 GHVS01040109.1:62-427(+)